jgi:7-carboxy-7-deazaguanine synthase
MKVNEIFYSIQGESTHGGKPCAFVRFSGCNLRCSYCDSTYAYEEGREMSAPEIIRAIAAFPTKLALITGGEPLLQDSIHEFLCSLLDEGYAVCLETGGQMPVDRVDARVHKIVDFKCPSSGMQPQNRFENIEFLTARDEVKFVVGDRADFDWACEMIRRHGLSECVGALLFSPAYRRLAYPILAEWILASGLPVRMQLQLHKIIWPGVERGV